MALILLETGMPSAINGLSGTASSRNYLTELGFVSGGTVEVIQHAPWEQHHSGSRWSKNGN